MPPSSTGTNLTLCLEARTIPHLFGLLRQGFMVKAQVGCTIKAFLCQQLGLTPEYLERRIQTIFLDGKPIDDASSPIVHDGSTLALSAALPGLAGAALRRGGPASPMRSQISHGKGRGAGRSGEGMIKLKLFNLLLEELGPDFLKQGVWVSGKELGDLLGGQTNDFWAGCKWARVDGRDMDLDRLCKMRWTNRHVFLKVQGEDACRTS